MRRPFILFGVAHTLRRRILITLATLLAAIGGALTAVLIAAPAALAWSPGNVPAGFVLDHIVTGGVHTCPEAYQFIAPAVSQKLCLDSPTFQQDFDAFVDAHYTAPVTTTAQASTTATTATAQATTTDAAATTTSQQPTAPTDTTTAITTSAGTTTAVVTGPPVTQPAVTTTVTVIVSACDAVCVAHLQAEIDALGNELRALEQIVGQFPNLDPAILAALMALQS